MGKTKAGGRGKALKGVEKPSNNGKPGIPQSGDAKKMKNEFVAGYCNISARARSWHDRFSDTAAETNVEGTSSSRKNLGCLLGRYGG